MRGDDQFSVKSLTYAVRTWVKSDHITQHQNLGMSSEPSSTRRLFSIPAELFGPISRPSFSMPGSEARFSKGPTLCCSVKVIFSRLLNILQN
jgi:hypothetical protein